MDHMLDDARFARIAKDPKFKQIPRTERKVKIDKRFEGMFKNKKFTVKYSVDKRGKPTKQTTTENLKKYYDMSSSEEELSEDSSKVRKEKSQGKVSCDDTKQAVSANNLVDLSDHNSSSDDSENIISSNGQLLLVKPANAKEALNDIEKNLEKHETTLHCNKNEVKELTSTVKDKLRDLAVNYARGESTLFTDSSSEEETDLEDDEKDPVVHDWGELDKNAETTDEATHRLAVCNMDWDRIQAVDLMVLFNSFLPSGGVIHSVTVYPSEFGQQRMKEEEANGPCELIEADPVENDMDGETDNIEEGGSYRMEKLRQYQLNRLKYYYAVIDCDSPDTANKIYKECDGTEYECTSTKLDLRFIPNNMEFEQTPREMCDKLPELSKYQPRQFTTTALQQVKVELTWDETNQERQEVNRRLNSKNLDEVNENDIRTYLASCSSDEESGCEEAAVATKIESDFKSNNDSIEKYKSILKAMQEQEEDKAKKDVELEFTWGLGVKEKSEKLIKEKSCNKDLTPFEQYLEKRKSKKQLKKQEQRQVERSSNLGLKSKTRMSENNYDADDSNDEAQRKAELELLLMNRTDDDNKQHFNMKSIEDRSELTKSKRKRLNKAKNEDEKTNEDTFTVNVNDSRFNALFTSHHFNIDPADPHYRKTQGTKALVNEKIKRHTMDTAEVEVEPKRSKTEKQLNAKLQTLVKSVKNNVKKSLVNRILS